MTALTHDEMVQKVHAHYAKRKGGAIYLGERKAADTAVPAVCRHGEKGNPTTVALRMEGMSFGYGHPAGIVATGEIHMMEGECPDCGATLYAILDD